MISVVIELTARLALDALSGAYGRNRRTLRSLTFAEIMCELFGLLSNGLVTVNLSLSKLAEHGALAGTLHDGWGVGYYEGLDARLIKEAGAATESEWLRFISQHDLRSSLVMAHARTATRGKRSYANAQPFVRELAGRIHLFAHNGDLPGVFDDSAPPERFIRSGNRFGDCVLCVAGSDAVDLE